MHALAALVSTLWLATATALITPLAMAVEVPAAAPVMAQLLFVQNAAGVEVGAGGRTLTLKGVSPTTLFFSDRPCVLPATTAPRSISSSGKAARTVS